MNDLLNNHDQPTTNGDHKVNEIRDIGNMRHKGSSKVELPVYHVVNPNHTTWNKLLPTITKKLGPTIKVFIWSEWVEALQNSATSTNELDSERHPAAKVLDFFQSIKEAAEKGKAFPFLETSKTVKHSKTLADLGAVSPEWMEIWLRQWNF